MFEWDFVRSVTSMRLMAELASDHGMALSASLLGTGVMQKDLDALKSLPDKFTALEKDVAVLKSRPAGRIKR